MSAKKIPVISRIDHGLNHKPTETAPTRYELHFEHGAVLYTNALPDTAMFTLQHDKNDSVKN